MSAQQTEESGPPAIPVPPEAAPLDSSSRLLPSYIWSRIDFDYMYLVPSYTPCLFSLPFHHRSGTVERRRFRLLFQKPAAPDATAPCLDVLREGLCPPDDGAAGSCAPAAAGKPKKRKKRAALYAAVAGGSDSDWEVGTPSDDRSGARKKRKAPSRPKAAHSRQPGA